MTKRERLENLIEVMPLYFSYKAINPETFYYLILGDLTNNE